MKKIIIRILGSLCLLAAVAAMFMPAWVKLDSDCRKEVREFTKLVSSDLDAIQQNLTRFATQDVTLAPDLSQNDSFVSPDSDLVKEELKDNDLPRTEIKIRRRIKETRELVKDLTATEFSVNALTGITFKVPQYIKDTETVLSAENVSMVVFASASLVSIEDAEELIGDIADFGFIFYIAGGFLLFMVAFGVLAAVTHSLNKARFLKYIFLVFLIIMVVGTCVALPFLAEGIMDDPSLGEHFEDLAFNITAMPFIAVALSIVPIVLDCAFERKKEKAA